MKIGVNQWKEIYIRVLIRESVIASYYWIPKKEDK